MVAVVDLATTKTTGEGKNALQDMGSTLTYYRRYALQSVLGLAAEEDDDGARGGGSSGSGGGRSEAAITTPAPARKPDAEIRMPVARGEILGTAKPLVAVPPPAPAPVAGPVQEADEPGIVIFSDLKLTKKVAKEAPDGVSPHWVRTAFLTDTGRWVYTFETGATHADGSETVVAAMEKALTAGAPVRLRTRERKMTNGSVGYEVLAVS
jgi:hypothetical protein